MTKVPPGRHIVSFFDENKLSSAERKMLHGTIYDAAGSISKDADVRMLGTAVGIIGTIQHKEILAGTQYVFVRAGETTDVYLEYAKVRHVTKKAQKVFGGCLIGTLACLIFVAIIAANSSS